MKKIITLVLALAIMMAISLSLIGCGSLGDIGGLIGDGDNGETQTEKMKTKKEIENALGDNYQITLKIGYSSSDSDDGASIFTTKRVGNAVYTTVLDKDNNFDAYLLVGNKAYSEYDEDADKFTQCSILEADSYNPYTDVVKKIMSEYDKEIEYNSKTSEKMLDGRKVTVYKRTQSASMIVASVKYEWVYAIDDTTGLCLKREMSFSGSSVEESTNTSVCFTVTDMKLGGVTLTDEMNKIAIDEWPTTADFTTFGIDSIAKVDGKLRYAEALVSNEGEAISLEYYYDVTDSSLFDTLRQAFYSAGFDKNYDCEATAIAELTTSNEYGNTFEGYIGEEGHYSDFSVEIKLEPTFKEGEYTLYLKLYNSNADV